jgi:hypothetical protein
LVFPDFPPYGSAYEDVVPHLTVGHMPVGDIEELRSAEVSVRRALPIGVDPPCMADDGWCHARQLAYGR